MPPKRKASARQRAARNIAVRPAAVHPRRRAAEEEVVVDEEGLPGQRDFGTPLPARPNPEAALDVIARYWGISGAHHKQWVVDQVVRNLTAKRYGQWVRNYRNGADGPNTYAWEEGIPP